MKSDELKKFILSSEFENVVRDIYCSTREEVIDDQRQRYLNTLDEAVKLYGDGDYHIISSPGRVEIGGNHTDHQRGSVVAASINIDNLCFVKKSDDMVVTFADKVFGVNEIDISDLKVHEDEKSNTKSILRGTAARYKELGYGIGGFKAFQDMRVLVGSGLSSSACFEILITEIYNYFYNEDKITAVERAMISQWVENNYFGKPCGLMDQMAISVGSFVSIDFHDEKKPKIEKHSFSFADYDYQLLVINTRADHADLTDEYAAIPAEMKEVAKYYGVDVLSQVDENEFFKDINKLRETIKNDRAILRAYHYFNENNRVKELNQALKDNDIAHILTVMTKSGNSSYKYLQNVYAASDTKNQAVAIALAMSKKYVGDDGICRVQGGGFAGTIQVVIERYMVNEFIDKMGELFGKDAIMPVEIRSSGTRVIV
ncbi:MAG: galactokinase [Lachnospiraceae bacterium]|nr:galactokinase [Lachnospiraceae bacterium]